MHAALVCPRAVAVAVVTATSSLRAAWRRGGGGGSHAARCSQHRLDPHHRHVSCSRAVSSAPCGSRRVSPAHRRSCALHANSPPRRVATAIAASAGAAGGAGGDDGSASIGAAAAGPGPARVQARGITSLAAGRPAAGKAGRQRLDELTIERHPEHSRTVVQSWIAQGKVLVDGQPMTKAGTRVKSSVKIAIIADNPKFVCRGGLKLEKALTEFEIDVVGKVILDAGLSTGGFTDCALQGGATRVYGVDVGYGQVAEKVRVDPRVVVMERTNLRYLQPLPELVDIATLDLSFISVLKVLPAVAAAMKPGGQLVVLIKPQFEATRGQIGAKGVVRDTKVHQEVIKKVIDGAGELGFEYVRHTVSPIKGAKEGNTEFLALFTRTDLHMPPPPPPPAKVE